MPKISGYILNINIMRVIDATGKRYFSAPLNVSPDTTGIYITYL